ncbi:MAG: hypothetical protein JXR60_00080 [Bacteroidales bacterium]|nr:hypothetical protein [Bacteroidales bacterium]
MRISTSILFLSLSLCVWAQNVGETVKAEKQSINIFSFSASYSYTLTGGDMAFYYGANSRIGGAFNFKNKTDWYFSLEGTYLFGSNLKDTTYGVFDGIKTSEGYVTSKFGTPADYALNLRGFTVMLKAGRILSFAKINEQSGFLISAGAGFFQHHLRIDNNSNDTPQILDEYKKGYDHLHNGIALSQFAGYIYHANNKMLNVVVGFEITEGFTKNRRQYNYDTMQYDLAAKLDLMYSFKLGIIVPIARRTPSEFYIY